MGSAWNEVRDAHVFEDSWKDAETGKSYVQVNVGEGGIASSLSVAYELTEEGDEHLQAQRNAAYKDMADGLLELVERVTEKYTDEPLDWSLASRRDSIIAELKRRCYDGTELPQLLSMFMGEIQLAYAAGARDAQLPVEEAAIAVMEEKLAWGKRHGGGALTIAEGRLVDLLRESGWKPNNE